MLTRLKAAICTSISFVEDGYQLALVKVSKEIGRDKDMIVAMEVDANHKRKITSYISFSWKVFT
ncbi:hypothetical protein TSUD_102840 [Trifolium subterraneum]|uniref:Uncharacterized protein n=1 Tax=Trifolium subterraneum TaxID=3900 RepID=A0A2Z6P5S3_TRISU|nr:hypothetical protein TSUD_102840 [Trifolium subterraneum]